MHLEILNLNTFSLLQMSELFSSHTLIIITVSYVIKIQQICEDNLKVFNTNTVKQ